MNDTQEKEYRTPSLEAYGSVEDITRNQNSAGDDVPKGPGDANNYYSVGK